MTDREEDMCPSLRSGPQADGLPAQRKRPRLLTAIGFTPLSGRIRLGKVREDRPGVFVGSKAEEDVTDMCVDAVLRYWLHDAPRGCDIEGETPDGRKLKISVSVDPPKPDESRSAEGVRTEGPDRAGGHT